MNDTDKARIFKYMEWLFAYQNNYSLIRYPHYHLDAIDMVLAMNKMVEKVDWRSFYIHSKTLPSTTGVEFIPWLMQPERFFELMAKWLEVRE